MSFNDGDGGAAERRRERLDVVQLRALAGGLARRSVRPAAALVAVVAALRVGAQAQATLPVIVVLAVVWCRRRR